MLSIFQALRNRIYLNRCAYKEREGLSHDNFFIVEAVELTEFWSSDSVEVLSVTGMRSLITTGVLWGTDSESGFKGITYITAMLVTA